MLAVETGNVTEPETPAVSIPDCALTETIFISAGTGFTVMVIDLVCSPYFTVTVCSPGVSGS